MLPQNSPKSDQKQTQDKITQVWPELQFTQPQPNYQREYCPIDIHCIFLADLQDNPVANLELTQPRIT